MIVQWLSCENFPVNVSPSDIFEIFFLPFVHDSSFVGSESVALSGIGEKVFTVFFHLTKTVQSMQTAVPFRTSIWSDI